MAGFNIDRFKSLGMRDGGARPTQYTVTLTFPQIPEIPSMAAQQLQFQCRAASLPGSSIGSFPVYYYGRPIKVAGDRTFQPWRVSIYNTEDFNVRNALEAWHNAINSIIGNTMDERVAAISSTDGNSYKTRAIVTQFSKVGPGDIDGDGAIKSYTFEGLFPVDVGEINLAYDAVDQIEEFPVVFDFDWWLPSQRANDIPIFPVES